jgi:hypothetical protein
VVLVGEHDDARAGSRPLGEYAASWIAGRSLAPRTRELYEDLLRRHLEPHLGTTPLVRLTTDRIRSPPDAPTYASCAPSGRWTRDAHLIRPVRNEAQGARTTD